MLKHHFWSLNHHFVAPRQTVQLPVSLGGSAQLSNSFSQDVSVVVECFGYVFVLFLDILADTFEIWT